MNDADRTPEPSEDVRPRWVVTIRGVDHPFAGPDDPRWERWVRWVDRQIDPFRRLAPILVTFDPQERRLLHSVAFEALIRQANDPDDPTRGEFERSLEGVRGRLWFGMSIADPTVDRRAFERLIGTVPWTEYYWLKPRLLAG